MLRLDDYQCLDCGWTGELLVEREDQDQIVAYGCPACGKSAQRLIGAPRPIVEPFHRGTLIDRNGQYVRGRFER